MDVGKYKVKSEVDGTSNAALTSRLKMCGRTCLFNHRSASAWRNKFLSTHISEDGWATFWSSKENEVGGFRM